MKCPHCDVAIKIEWDESNAYIDKENPTRAYEVLIGQCPNCEKLIVKLRYGRLNKELFSISTPEIESEEIIYPKFPSIKVEEEVPEPYKCEFREAFSILNISQKASAALSRRMLQNILHDEFNIKKRNLAEEIDEFIKLPGVPTHLSGAIDVIRNVGNFGAHPLNDIHSGEIVNVEYGEAEWSLEVLQSLFDFTFVQPKRLAEKKKNLNTKLEQMGKPPMKEYSNQ